jgi:hypothetical protein
MSVRIKAYYKHSHGENPVILETAQDADALVDAMLGEEFEKLGGCAVRRHAATGQPGIPRP